MINLFPKDEIFYNLFEKQAEKLTEAACLLDEILKNPQNLKDLSLKMKKLETEADSLGHEIVSNLERSFITPLEGEDINLLRQKLDDIMDHIEKAVNRMFLYKIPRPFPKEIEEYVKIIRESIKEINLGVKEIRNVRKFQSQLRERCQNLNELEDKGDVINRSALEKLMNVSQTSPEKNLEIIKLKEVYEYLEDAIDYCEDVGNIFESILIKNR
ncbi:DUF47 family protein [Patescibacteria group bacterium]|nr:DUF47 family protein [Patescibacteria group bacterium]